ncbi:MAG TPA: hypothetical protein VK968_02675 [Roseimicrobium sp.]|nr:hypothetical protein [Roseimicrobium sp.]
MSTPKENEEPKKEEPRYLTFDEIYGRNTKIFDEVPFSIEAAKYPRMSSPEEVTEGPDDELFNDGCGGLWTRADARRYFFVTMPEIEETVRLTQPATPEDIERLKWEREHHDELLAEAKKAAKPLTPEMIELIKKII